ncbi:helix-turn-helix domain-containing protein [Xanthobacter oligotrophicus]|uniref:helix-turn-helix domain-containing protein n=1 Tax=Xanthobacter oligotrophicus TaxID=2607286 RepID=UPI00372D2DE5
MNADMLVNSPELARQREQAKARRARLFGLCPAQGRPLSVPPPKRPSSERRPVLSPEEAAEQRVARRREVDRIRREKERALREGAPPIQRVIPPLPEGYDPLCPTVPAIMRFVAAYYGCTAQDLQSPSRIHTVVKPRQVAMYLAKTLTTRSMSEVARRFGGRDHTTALHAVRKIAALIGEASDLTAEVEALRLKLTGGDAP